ncbi:MAG: diheme cytochrome c [Lysobacteraceae bacterium]
MSRTWIATALLCAMMLPSGAFAAGDDDENERSPRRAPMPAVYVEECGGCHVPYPASGLPAASWDALMSGLNRHFGSDASLAPQDAGTIRRWLRTNAGRSAANRTEPLRITRTAWFLREHDEIPVATWRSPAVRSAANCAACHRGAERGDFSEHDVRIPRASPLRPAAGSTR